MALSKLPAIWALFGAAIAGLACWALYPEMHLASVQLVVASTPDSRCTDPDPAGTFSHLGTIRDLIHSPKIANEMKVPLEEFDRYYHVRRRLDSHVLWLEVRGDSLETSRKQAIHWAAVGSAYLSHIQAVRLAELTDPVIKRCAEAGMLRVVSTTPYDVRMTPLDPPVVEVSLAAGVIILFVLLVHRKRFQAG